MKLACLQDYIPIGRSPTKCFGNTIAEGKDAERIEESKNSPNCECPRISPTSHHNSANLNLSLHPVEACPNHPERQLTQYLPVHPLNQANNWPRNPRHGHGAYKRPGHRPWERKVIITSPQTRRHIPKRQPIGQNIMSGLDIKRLLDLRVRRQNEMHEDEQGHESREEGI